MRTIIYDKHVNAIDSSNPLPVRKYGNPMDVAGHEKTTRGYVIKTATITTGTSLSTEIDLEGYGLVAIQLPNVFEGASMTFQAATATEGTYFDVYDSAGNELTATIGASRVITDLPELGAIRFLKVRSGTSGTPVNQAGGRTITLILKG